MLEDSQCVTAQALTQGIQNWPPSKALLQKKKKKNYEVAKSCNKKYTDKYFILKEYKSMLIIIKTMDGRPTFLIAFYWTLLFFPIVHMGAD